MIRKIIILNIVIVLGTIHLCAQNDLQISQYMFTKLLYNPAIAGAGSYFENKTKVKSIWQSYSTGKPGTLTNIYSSALIRKHQVGIDGSPFTQALNIDLSLSKLGGFGLSFYNDAIGIENYLIAKCSYAYILPIDKDIRLSMGLSVGLLNKGIRTDDLNFLPELDPVAFSSKSAIKPNFDAGLYLMAENFTLGVSSTHIDRSLKNSNSLSVPRHYYLFTDYTLAVSENFEIVPALFVKSTSFISQIDLNNTFVYVNKMWGGISYRFLKESIVCMAGLYLTKTIRMGYSIDLPVSDKKIRNETYGSHEIVISWIWSKSATAVQHKSPRLFD
ncbi:MAG: PorP/SprF family type IX secretion system membrane protein [Bacteroidales bacterium]